jgi:hypothetical protein
MNPIDFLKIKTWISRIPVTIKFNINDDNSIDIFAPSEAYKINIIEDIPIKIRKCEGVFITSTDSFRNFPSEIIGGCYICKSNIKKMSELPIKYFKGTSFTITNTELEEVDCFPYYTKELSRLNFSDNHIKSVAGLPRITSTVILQGNEIELFDYSYGDLTALFINNNPIKSFGNLKRLEHLTISVDDFNDAEEMIKKLKNIECNELNIKFSENYGKFINLDKKN